MILYLAKLSLKSSRDNKKTRNFVRSAPALQEMLKGILRLKIKHGNNAKVSESISHSSKANI